MRLWPAVKRGDLDFASKDFDGLTEAFAHPDDAQHYLHHGLVLDGIRRRVEIISPFPHGVLIRVWTNEHPALDATYAWRNAA